MAKILVVDDSAAVRNDVSNFLTDHNLEVVTAIDGKDGFDKIKNDSDIKLVLLDVNMPVMDGLTMAEKVRNELNDNVLNIIMLTTENDPNMKARGKAAGVKGWIVKPFNGENVVNTLRKLVQ